MNQKWYIVQVFSLLLLLVHLEALKTRKVRFGLLGGPGEGIFIFHLLLLTSAFVGPQRMLHWWLSFSSLPLLRWVVTPSIIYYAVVLTVVWRAVNLPAHLAESRNGILFCLAFRVTPAVLFYLGWVQEETLLNVVCDGLFVSVITTDLALAKMSKRNLHPFLWLFAMASSLNFLAIIVIVVAYYGAVFYELKTYLKLPMFTLAINVYVDGVYDLTHLGHMNVRFYVWERGGGSFSLCSRFSWQLCRMVIDCLLEFFQTKMLRHTNESLS